MSRMRCKSCVYFCYDFFNHRYEKGSFCGLHGRAEVDPNGIQRNLDARGSCGYRNIVKQLNLFDYE